MAFTGYLKIEKIKGESKRADHEDEIDVFGVEWKVSQSSSASTGSGRSRGRATIGDLIVHKWYDAASPHLALACMNGTALDEIVFSARKDSGEAHLDYITVTMEKGMVSGYQLSQSQAEDSGEDRIIETVSFSFEKIGILYKVQSDDHSAGDEHEVEYDIVAGR